MLVIPFSPEAYILQRRVAEHGNAKHCSKFTKPGRLPASVLVDFNAADPPDSNGPTSVAFVGCASLGG